MSGGSWDIVMGNMVTPTNVPMVGNNSTWNSKFNGTLYDGSSFTTGTSLPSSKYYDSYSYNTTASTLYSRGKLGDATKEIMVSIVSSQKGWYLDSSYFLYGSRPWLGRGGTPGFGTSAGIFNFLSDFMGSAQSSAASRSVISKF